MGPPPIFAIFGLNGSPNIKKDSFCPLFVEFEKKIDFHHILGVLGGGPKSAPPGRIRPPDFLSGRGFVSLGPIQFWSTDLKSPIFGRILHIFFRFSTYHFRWGDEIGPPPQAE